MKKRVHENNILLDLGLFFILGLVFLTMYALAQKIVRTDANSPQIYYAQDDARLLAMGVSPASLVPENSVVDVSNDLGTFVSIYNDQGEITASSATLDGTMPVMPQGVFDYVRTHGEDRLTWQPASGVRSAVVVDRYVGTSGSGFVAVGRSLKEIEKTETDLLKIAVVGWIVSSLALMFFVYLWRKKS